MRFEIERHFQMDGMFTMRWRNGQLWAESAIDPGSGWRRMIAEARKLKALVRIH